MAVIFAAVGVFGTGSLIPDLMVALVMSILGLTGGYQVIMKAIKERQASKRIDLVGFDNIQQ